MAGVIFLEVEPSQKSSLSAMAAILKIYYIIVNKIIGKLDGQTCMNVVPIDLQGIINIQDCQKI